LYKSIGHYYVGSLLLKGEPLSSQSEESFKYLYCPLEGPIATATMTEIRIPKNLDEGKYFS